MKKQKLLLLTLMLAFTQFSIAQITFQKKYRFNLGSSQFNSVKQTTDGGYIFAGGNGSNSNPNNVYLMKINAIGDTLWTRTYGVPQGFSFARSVFQTFDGGYLVCGYIQLTLSGFFNFYIIRTDSVGDTLWTKSLSHPSAGSQNYCYSALQTNDSNFITFGRQGLFEVDFYLNKWSSSGNIIWSKSYSIPGNYDFGNSVYETSDHGFIMGGNSTNNGSINEILIIKADSAGNLQWAKTYASGSTYDECNAVRQTPDGGYLITGATQSYGGYLIKLNAMGDTLWTRSYTATGGVYCYSIEQAANQNYILTGFTGVGTTNQLLLINVDSSGAVNWSKSYGNNTDFANGYSVAATNDGGFISSGNIHFHAFVVKTDASGNSGCNESTVAVSVSNAPFEATSVTPASGNNSHVTSPPTVVGSGTVVTTLCSSTGIQTEEPEPFVISVYPNPAGNNIKIEFNDRAYSGVFSIYNLVGEKLFETKLINQKNIVIDICKLPLGVYFTKLQSENTTTVTKFIKQ